MTRSTATGTAAPAVPPWPLVWLVAGVASLPATAAVWLQYVADLTGTGDYPPEVVGTPSFALLRLTALVQFVPSVFVLVGLLGVLLPHLRAAVVERRLQLRDVQKPVVDEIRAFLAGQGVDVEIRCNLAAAGRMVRVYPAGWRRARLAVFGPFVVLWRRDRAAAEAVLLHEVAHVRTGDHLLLGLGSPFVALVNLWLPLFVLFAVLPVVGFAVVGYPTTGQFPAQLLVLLTSVPRLLLLPVGALWWAELSADRFVRDTGRQEALLRALTLTGGRRGRLFHLSHPPDGFRRWALLGGPGRDLVLLAGWPLLALVQLAVTLGGAVPGWFLLGAPDVLGLAATNSVAFLLDSARIWAPAAVLLVAWPVLGRAWAWCWTGTLAARPVTAAYLGAGVLVAAVMPGLAGVLG